jgi:hypothetical protein
LWYARSMLRVVASVTGGQDATLKWVGNQLQFTRAKGQYKVARWERAGKADG